MSTPAIVFFLLSVAALLANWRKERIADGQHDKSKSAIRFAFSVQVISALAGGYAIYAADGEARLNRQNQVRSQAEFAAGEHLKQATDTYLKCIRPGYATLSSLASIEKGLANEPPALLESIGQTPVMQRSFAKREQIEACFSNMQDKASAVLADGVKFGKAFPEDALVWADMTLKLKKEQLAELSGDTELSAKYVFLMSKALAEALAAANAHIEELMK